MVVRSSPRTSLVFGLLSLIAVLGSIEAAQDSDSSFYLNLRPRLGHFSQVEGYGKVFEEYFNNVIKQNDRGLEQVDINDWRNVRPSGELCLNFLQGFQVKGYKLNKPFDIIPLDACLDWLNDESDEKETDLERFNVAAKEQTTSIAKDTKLNSLYRLTDFDGDKIPDDVKEKIHEYLSKLLKIYADNPRSGCNGLWLEAYDDFIEDVYLDGCDSDDDCLHFGGFESSESDSYLKLVVESTKFAAKNCYNIMMKQMQGLMTASFDKESSVTTILSKKIGKIASSGSDGHKFNADMTKILQLISGKNNINLLEVAESLKNVKENDQETIDRITKSIAAYATQNVNVKDSANDVDGRARFGKTMTKICSPYIDKKSFLAQIGGANLLEDSSSTKKPFEFYNLIYSLIRITNQESIYGISKDMFEDDVMKFQWEPLYLTTFACQIISTTWGELDYDTNAPEYQVSLRPDADVQIEDWPITVIEAKLAALNPRKWFNSGDSKEQKKPVGRPMNRPTVGLTKHAREKKLGLSLDLLKNAKLGRSSDAKQPQKTAQSSQNEQPKESVVQPEPVTYMMPSKPQPTVMSLQTIEMFRDLHGRYPKNMPEYIREIYPQIPEDYKTAEYPKKSIMPVKNENAAPKVEEPKPVAKPAPVPAPAPVRAPAVVEAPAKYDPDDMYAAYARKKQVESSPVHETQASSGSKWSSMDALSL